MLKPKRKRVIFSTKTFEDYNAACKDMDKEGISIDKIAFDVSFRRYDVHVIATKEEAYKLFDLTTKYNAVLWKGES